MARRKQPHEPFRPKGHTPNCRPVREERRGTETYRRIPPDGPLTPRLQPGGVAHPIGFTVERLPGYDDWDD